jgi:hypothetical protein
MRQAIRMFDSLLDISRAEADQGIGGGLVPVDLSAVAAEVWELYEPLAEDKGLIPRAEIAPGLRVLGDRNLIAQGLANLLDNAIKYCAPGDSLTLTLFAADRHVLRVADTGPGLPEGTWAKGVRTVHPGRARPRPRHQGPRAGAGAGARHRGAARRAAVPAQDRSRSDGRDRLWPDGAGLAGDDKCSHRPFRAFATCAVPQGRLILAPCSPGFHMRFPCGRACGPGLGRDAVHALLIVGVSDYLPLDADLKGPSADAALMAETLLAPGRGPCDGDGAGGSSRVFPRGVTTGPDAGRHPGRDGGHRRRGEARRYGGVLFLGPWIAQAPDASGDEGGGYDEILLPADAPAGRAPSARWKTRWWTTNLQAMGAGHDGPRRQGGGPDRRLPFRDRVPLDRGEGVARVLDPGSGDTRGCGVGRRPRRRWS